MTLQDVITKVKNEKPNTFGNDKFVEFINEVEAAVYDELRKEFTPFTTDDLSESLIVPAPYDCLYISYVKSQVDYANEEYASYQLNQEQYNADFAEFENFVVRTGFEQEESTISYPHRYKGIW